MGPKAFYMDHKKTPPKRGFSVDLTQSGFERLDLGGQAALVASNLVLGEDSLVYHAVHDRLGFLEGLLGLLVVTCVDLGLNLLHISTRHGPQAGVMLTVLLVLTCALLGLRGICHRVTPENLCENLNSLRAPSRKPPRQL